MKKSYVVLVDKHNRRKGVEEKMKAHREGKLHRAISIFIFNGRGETLLQRRAQTKYHSGGLWTNTVCSHPGLYETFKQAAHRRLQEEFGFDCKLKKVSFFIYRAQFQNGLTEYEYDNVFAGIFNGTPKPDPKEIMDYKWISLKDLKKDLAARPQAYTAWLKPALKGLNVARIKNS